MRLASIPGDIFWIGKGRSGHCKQRPCRGHSAGSGALVLLVSKDGFMEGNQGFVSVGRGFKKKKKG